MSRILDDEDDLVKSSGQESDANVISTALDLGLQAWRTTESRERFMDAFSALGRLRRKAELCDEIFEVAARSSLAGDGLEMIESALRGEG